MKMDRILRPRLRHLNQNFNQMPLNVPTQLPSKKKNQAVDPKGFFSRSIPLILQMIRDQCNKTLISKVKRIHLLQSMLVTQWNKSKIGQ